MTVLRTDRKHASNCMTEENGVEKVKKRKNFFRSLRFRILIILVILGIVPSVIVAHVMVAAYENKAVAVRKQTVEKQCDILCNLLIKENYMNDSSSQDVNSKLELLSNVYDGRILLVDRDYRIIKDTYGVDEGKTLISTMVIKCFKGEEASRYNSKTQKIEMALPVKSPEVKQLQGAMLISFSSNEIAENILELEQKSLLITGIIIVLAVLLGYVLSTVLVKPFARVTKSIEDLTDGYQNEEISVPDYTETALITDAFNKMLSRMKILDESRNEFVSNVSHELKTPLTAISGYAELIENHMVDPEQETRFAQEIQQNATRLLSLINDIIRLSELDSGEDNLLCFEQVDLDEVAGTCVKNLQMNAQKRNVTLYYEGVSCMLRADRGMISELVENLCQNAIRYNNEGGEVHVRVYYEKGQPMLSVADNGIGIPKDQQERIFERFYRVDKSRSKQTGGTGLGLAIVKHIVELHDAVLHLESEPGKGTTITVAF